MNKKEERRWTDMRCVDRRIAKAIYHAQAASDGGKGISELQKWYAGSLRGAGYPAKDTQILLAIDLINKSHSKTFRYSVKRGRDQNGCSSFIVYFDFKIDGKREQVSFHSFNKKLWNYVKRSRASTWSKDRSSRDSVELLRKSVS